MPIFNPMIVNKNTSDYFLYSGECDAGFQLQIPSDWLPKEGDQVQLGIAGDISSGWNLIGAYVGTTLLNHDGSCDGRLTISFGNSKYSGFFDQNFTLRISIIGALTGTTSRIVVYRITP